MVPFDGDGIAEWMNPCVEQCFSDSRAASYKVNSFAASLVGSWFPEGWVAVVMEINQVHFGEDVGDGCKSGHQHLHSHPCTG